MASAVTWPSDAGARPERPPAVHSARLTLRPAGAGRAAIATVCGWDLIAGEYGPGTRFVLFTAGCPLRCLSCPDPRRWTQESSRPVAAAQLMDLLDRYRPLFDVTGGGATLAGGEPLLHAPFVAATARATREAGIHLALATSGTYGDRLDDAALTRLDLVLLNLKAYRSETFRRLTGRAGGDGLRLARRVAAQGTPIRVRWVVVPGVTDDAAELDALAAVLAGLGTVERVDVVPFDRAGDEAWSAVGLDFPLARCPGPTREALAAVRAVFAAHGLAAG